MQGWVKLHRTVTDSFAFQNPDRLKFWIWCLCKATHKERTQPVGLQEVELQPGQFVFGRKKASSELGMDESKVYRLIKTFEKREKIEVKSNNKYSVVTIVNWSFYQDDEQQTEQQSNNKITTNEQQSNTNKNVKNNKNVNNDIYNILFDYYLTLDLVKHRTLTKDMIKGIDKAKKELNLELEEMKRMLKRHSEKVEATKSSEFKTKRRSLSEFFGQKKYGSVSLICSDYLDDTYQAYEPKKEIKPQNKFHNFNQREDQKYPDMMEKFRNKH